MTNWQFYSLMTASISALVTALASLGVVALGLVSNNKRLDDMRADIRDFKADMKADMHDLRGLIAKLGEDYTRFYGEQRKHDAEIANIKERLK